MLIYVYLSVRIRNIYIYIYPVITIISLLKYFVLKFYENIKTSKIFSFTCHVCFFKLYNDPLKMSKFNDVSRKKKI